MRILIFTFSMLSLYVNSFAAVGCSLNDPDRDIKKIFPDSSGYKTTFITLKEIGAEPLRVEIENRLGDKLDSVYESLDVPYAYYSVLKNKEIIGYVHGVNQKGRYGVLQLIVAVDLQGKILNFYYQKITSPESEKFRDVAFTNRFIGLTLQNFDDWVNKIVDPSLNNAIDFKATLRGIKKDLILLDVFLSHKKLNNDSVQNSGGK